MKDKINFIDVNRKLDHEEIYNLFKTHSTKINNEITEKIDIFIHNLDFFEFYSNEDINNILDVFKLKLSKNDDEFFSSFKVDIEQYISCISQIILSMKLFLKAQNKLTKIVFNAKNHLSKLKYNNEIENYNQDDLFLYLESLFKISEENSKVYSIASTLLNNNILSLEVTPKNSIIRKFSAEYNIDNYFNDEIKFTIYDNPPTPRFEFESVSEEDFGNQKNKNSNLDNSTEDSNHMKKESVLTLSNYVFIEEPIISINPEPKLIESSEVKSKIKINSTEENILQYKNSNKQKYKRNISSENDSMIKKNNKNYYKNLLEMINKIYKMGMINSEEKVKLKQLLIGKSKKIEYLYYSIYINSKNDKKTLTTEVKKIVN